MGGIEERDSGHGAGILSWRDSAIELLKNQSSVLRVEVSRLFNEPREYERMRAVENPSATVMRIVAILAQRLGQ
jgi:hypothetical protein